MSMRWFAVAVALMLIISLVACGGGPSKTLTAIAVSPATQSVPLGRTQLFTATGTYSDNTTSDVSTTVTWTSSNSAVATVAAGLATSKEIGAANITATSGTLTSSGTLTVTAAQLASMAITPGAPAVAVGLTQQLSCTGTYTDNTTQNMTAGATWTSSNTTVATVSSSGLATAKAAGTTTISASYGALSTSITFTVTPAALTSIAVTPATPSVAAGLTVQFAATGTYTDSTTKDITATVTWASSSTATATITAAGLATGRATGTSTISATSGSISGATTLTVNPPNLTAIAVTPATPTILAGTTQQFMATGTYSDNSTKDITATAAWSSSATGVATINNSGMASGVGAGTTTIRAASGAISGTANLKVITLTSIAVTPATPSIFVGHTQQLTATGTYSDSTTRDLTASATWTTSSASTATVSAGGLVTGIAAGPATITATSGAVSGAANVTVNAVALQSITVAPASPSVVAGNTQQFTATGNYNDGSTQNLTATAAWTSSNTAVATIANGGLATSIAAGTTTITATSGAISGPALLTVTPAPVLVSITLTPGSPTLTLGQTTTVQLTATGNYNNSTTQNLTATATWSSSNTAVATVSSGGLVTAVAAGTASITATSGSINNSVTVTVNPVPLTSIVVTPANPSIYAGHTQQFTATGHYADSTTKDITTSVTWASSSTATATITVNGGLATSVAAGVTTISATSGAVSGNTLLTVQAVTLSSIAVTPASPSLTVGNTQQFTATGTYNDSSTKDVTATVTWASTNTTVATISTGGLATARATGTTSITATSGSVSGNTTLTVNPAPLVSIAVTPANPSIYEGHTQQFTATGTYGDSSTKDITTSVNWTSSKTSVATITASGGLSTGVAAGLATITATSGAISGHTDLTVNAVTLTSIVVTPANPTVTVGHNQQFTATGHYNDSSTQDVTNSASWSSTNTAVATIASGGLASALSTGQTTITATSGAVNGTTQMTVVTGYQVSGQVTMVNSGGVAGITVALTPNTVAPVTTDNNGNFTFANVPGGNYTVTPSISGASSIFVPANQSLNVNADQSGVNFSVELGYTVSGTVSYAGSKTGRLYLSVQGQNNYGYTQGTSIAWPATSTFTIRGVPPGTYTVQASLDPSTLGFGAQNVTDPTGASGSFAVSTSTGNVSNVSVTLTDVSAPSLAGLSPQIQGASPMNQGAIFQFKPIMNANNVEMAESYNVRWSTSSSFTTTAGNTTIKASGTNNDILILDGANTSRALSGLSNGASLYFEIQGVNSFGTSSWSTPVGPIVIGAPATGNVVTGSVTFTGTATGPLYVGFYDQNTGGIYAATVEHPVSPQAYTVHVPTGSNYFFFGILDQNNDGLVDAGDIQNTEGDGAGVAISANVTENLTLPSGNSTLKLATQHNRFLNQGNNQDSYNLSFSARPETKLPVAVALVSGPNVLYPMDIATHGDGRFEFWPSLGSTRPNLGDVYGVKFWYGDGTSETLNATVTTVLDAFATNLAPQTGTSTTPTFTWTYPASASSYTYGFQMWGPNGMNIWQIPGNDSKSNGFSSTVTQIVWDTDPTGANNPPSVSSLTPGVNYNWSIMTTDANRNSATMQVNYQPQLPSPLVSIAVTPANSTIYAGHTQQFTATGTYADSSTKDITSTVNWSSSNTSAATITSSGGLASGVSPGLATITATSGSVSGQTGLTVTALTLTSIVVTPTNPTVTVNHNQQFTATGHFIDGSTGDVTSSVSWGSTNLSVATISTGGLASALSIGQTTISATSGSLSDTTQLTVIAGYQVSGQIWMTNGGGGVAGISVSLTPNAVAPVTTDSNGSFTFQGVPAGSYTVTPSISGASAVFSPTSQNLNVSSSQSGVNFDVTLGYTVSGTVSYAGATNGRIYLTLLGPNNYGYSQGTSIAWPSQTTFTIKGVPPGTYNLRASMDPSTLGFGASNATDPTGTSGSFTVSTATGNVSNVSVTLTDVSAPSLAGLAPKLQRVNPMSQGAVLEFQAILNGNYVEIPTSYNVRWSTNSAFTTTAGSTTVKASGTNNNVVILDGANTSRALTGLTNGASLYFEMQGVNASGNSSWSLPVGPIVIGAPTGNAISGSVTFTGTATGPLYVGYFDQNTGALYATSIQHPLSPQSFSVQVPTGSNYFFFGILDQNNDGLIDAGDIQNTGGSSGPAVVINAPMTGQNLVLPSGNSGLTLSTQHNRFVSQGVNNDSYNLSFNLRPEIKLPVAIQLVSGPNVLYPMDIGSRGDGKFDFWPGLGNVRPNIGDRYGLKVWYADNTSETLNVTVTTVLDAFPTNLAPQTGTSTSTTPTFTWTYPAGASSYVYNFQMWGQNGQNIWDIPGQNSKSNGFTNAVTQIVWGTDPTGDNNPPSVPSLTPGVMYTWTIMVNDANRNSASVQVNYQP